MAAATRDLQRPHRSNDRYGYPALAGQRFFKRALVAVTAAGFAVPAGHASAVAIVGVNELHVDNRDGVDGGQTVTAERGTFGFPLAGIAGAGADDIGKPVYAVDDATLDLASGGGTRLQAGVLDGISDGQAWITIPR